MKEIKIAKTTDLVNGEMKSFPVDDDNKILIVKSENNYYAFGAHCTHYGAPLEKGILNNETKTIICPWHHACFNSVTGNLMEPPARDSIPKFDLRIEEENIIVKIPEDLPSGVTPRMIKKDKEKDARKFVIVGGGAAGNAAAQSLRENDVKGEIIMVTQEDRVPYDRPNLSKDYLSGEADPEWMPLRPKEFYKENGIEILFGKKVTELDAINKKILFEDGEELKFDKVLIATGGIPRTLDIEGNDLKNIFYLRSFADSDEIISASKKSKKVVVIGSSFIGMEAAFSMHKRDLDVTVVSPSQVPFEKNFGKEIGLLFKNQHEELGIKFKLGTKPVKFEGNGKVEKVILEDDSSLSCDMVIVGIGVKPATDFIKGLKYEDDGSIFVDEEFKITSDVFAAGDIASFTDKASGEKTRIEHWRLAEQHGRNAGKFMAGKENNFNIIPFFWTMQAGLGLRYVGHAKKWDEIITWGEISSKKFISFFIKKDKVVAAAGNKRDKEMAAIHALFRVNKMPLPDEIRSNNLDVIKLAEE